MDRRSFIDAIKQHNIIRVRYSLSNELLMNPHGKDFDPMLHLAESKVPNLYERDNGKSYSSDKESWDKEFLYNLKNDLETNFSKEKLFLYKQVVCHIYNVQPKENMPSTTIKGGLLYPGLMIGGAIVGITGICVSKIVLTTLGAASFAFGTYMLYKDSKL